MMKVTQTCFFFLVWGCSNGTKAEGEQEDICTLLDPDASKVKVIYDTSVNKGCLWNVTGPLPKCVSGLGPVPLNTCRVCLRNEKEVEATCRRISSSAELRFEGDGKTFQQTCRSKVFNATLAPPTPPMPPTNLTSLSASPRPGLGAGVIALICVVPVFVTL